MKELFVSYCSVGSAGLPHGMNLDMTTLSRKINLQLTSSPFHSPDDIGLL